MNHSYWHLFDVDLFRLIDMNEMLGSMRSHSNRHQVLSMKYFQCMSVSHDNAGFLRFEQYAFATSILAARFLCRQSCGLIEHRYNITISNNVISQGLAAQSALSAFVVFLMQIV